MRKLIIPLMVLFALFFSLPSAEAKTFWRTYLVDEITDQGIILKDFEGNKFVVDKNPNQIKGGPLKAGDSVRYDSVKNKLKRNPWQPAAITNIGNNSISILLQNGDTAEVNMKSKYREQFKVGDHVEYQASKGQIKKSGLQPLD